MISCSMLCRLRYGTDGIRLFEESSMGWTAVCRKLSEVVLEVGPTAGCEGD